MMSEMNSVVDKVFDNNDGKPGITVAEYITLQVKLCGKPQLEIAKEAGFNKPNIITMIKQGKTKLPTAKIGPMAKALDVDPVYLFQLAMREYEPDTWEALKEFIFKAPVLSQNEIEIIETIRQSRVPNPKIRTDDERRALIEVISRLKPENAVAGD
jgi:transcriptional regulator with XRE-family HTH domain